MKRIFTRRRIALLVAMGVLFVILAVGGIATWEYTNSPQFCTTACHDVHPEETEVYEDSYHARVKCVECHTGRVSTLQAIGLKATHLTHLVNVITRNYERPLFSVSMRPANESCERCHWPEAFHDDSVREIRRFEEDEFSTENRNFLIMHTGGGTSREGLGGGIHWHVENEVRYITTDEQKLEIPWVEVTLSDGRKVTFEDAVNPLSASEVAAAEQRTMECVDCHNRVGHPFPSPENLADQALADGRLSRDLPYAKKEMYALLSASYGSHEEALEAVGEVRRLYESEYPEVAASRPAEIEAADALAQELIKRLVFDEEGITWESFPDHDGHREFTGCFRCHDGKHLSPEGESIRLHCNICHSIPIVVGEGDRPPQMPAAALHEPEFHLASNFMADHRFQASDDCISCHGEIEFGDDNQSFCGNAACHGTQWPSVELNAAFPHPIELEGQHAQAWCHDCHEGVKRPEYDCSNCHQPATDPHFGDDCSLCHSPNGFALAEMPDSFEHLVPLLGKHAEADCAQCHVDGKAGPADCASCHEPPTEPHFGDTCDQCHTPEGFGLAAMPETFQHPVPLVGEHAAADCTACHQEGQAVGQECRDCHQPPTTPHFGANCDVCHQPSGWVRSAAPLVEAAMPMAHPLEGSEPCLRCHDEGGLVPRPDDHLGRPQETCTVCHEPGAAAPDVSHDLTGRDACLLCHAVDSPIRSAPENHEGRAEEGCLVCHASS